MSIGLILTGFRPGPWVERLQRHAPDVPVRVLPDGRDADGIRYALVWKPPRGVLSTLPDLEVIFSLGAGVDHIFTDPDLPEVPVVRAVDADLTMRMSEYVVMHALIHHRHQRDYDARQRERVWRDRPQAAADAVRGGVMGLGVLGLDASEKLKTIGFDVAGWSRSRKDVPGVACFSGPDGLATFLARTDILVCLLPLTPETRGILNHGLFARLARDGPLGGPVLINAGRGGLQVEADILRALDDGTLKAATLDVFQTEPLPASSPLWSHPRVTVTPHIAADSDPDALCRYVLGQIARHERGELLDHVVDPIRQY